MPQAPDTIPFNRRAHARTPALGACTAVVMDDGQSCISGAELVDTGACGIGLRSRVPMRPGALCHLHQHGVFAIGDVGRVVRCERDGDDYRIGLIAMRRMAA